MKTQVGIDLGRSGTKVVAAFRDGHAIARKQLFFPAGVTRSFRIDHPEAAARAELDTVVVDGEAYFVGETALLQGGDTMHSGLRPDWISTPLHAAMLKGAVMKLAAAGVPGTATAHITVGLPGGIYGVKRAQYEQIVRRHLPNNEITVLPQPLGPFFAELFNASGGIAKPDMTGQSWATVEIGQYTTDTCLVVDGAAIESAFESCDGMHTVVRRLIKELRRTKDILEMSLAEGTTALEQRYVRHQGKDWQIDEELDVAASQLAEHIINYVPTAIGPSWRKLHGVLVAGGGAPLLFPKLATHWPTAMLCSEPRYAVAEGFVRVGLAAVAETEV